MNKKFACLHTHTVFCDGKDDVETMCRAAFEKGLSAIGFSSHAPMGETGLQSFWHLKNERLGEYINEVTSARRRWEGKLAVYLGLEVDYAQGLRSASDKDIRDLNLDYIIGSVHYLVPKHGAPFTVDGSDEELEKGIAEGYNGDGGAMMHSYWDAVANMIATGGFDIIGHLDLVKKKNRSNRWFNPESDDYKHRTAEITRAISENGIVVEVNTGAMNRGVHTEPFPSLEILRLLRQYNVPVMINADAHRANDLDGNYPVACQTIIDAGYTSHVTFEGRKDGKPIWQEREMRN